ncbi:MAG: GtrA family protein [Sulfurospirillum sp.]|nr:GtrA family protein [Sulfurospirillum sp.]
MSQIKKELKRFLVAGMGAVGTDLLTYYMLLNFLDTDIAKAISFLLGTIVAFIINKYWTFQKHEKSYKEIIKFSLLYTATLGANVITNKFILDTFSITIVAFLVATGVSMVLNFIGQKWWVFR